MRSLCACFGQDSDRIELSNLSRQFLFRNEHINKPKSVCAAQVAKTMNPDLNIVCHETKVGEDTENIFNDGFWMQLDGVWNALDNLEARLYTDSKCIVYAAPISVPPRVGVCISSRMCVDDAPRLAVIHLVLLFEIPLPHVLSAHDVCRRPATGTASRCSSRALKARRLTRPCTCLGRL